MRHLAIAAALLAAACGGSSAPATTTPPPSPKVEPEADPAPPPHGLELTENQILGKLLAVAWEDEEIGLCLVQLLMPDTGYDSFYEADPAICEEDHAASIGTDVVLFRTLTDPRTVTSITPADALE